MKIEEGKFYRTRDGRKVGPMKRVRHAMYPWICDHPFLGEYTEDGRFYFNQEAEDRADLVAEWSEPVLSGPAVELSTLADMDAQPGDIVGHLKDGTLPRCTVFTVESGQSLANEKVHMPFRDSWDTHARFFMIHRAPRGAGSIDSSPSEFWETPEEKRRRVYETRAKLDRVLGRTTPTDSPEPNPDHEAENSRDALLDGPDWRKHCAALMDTVDALCTADDEHHRLRCFFRHVDAIGAARRDLEAGA